MRPTIATVTSARPWERRLADAARSTGLIRVAARCSDPSAVRDIARRVDAVFVGSEAPWLTVAGLRALSSMTGVIGVVSGTDDPMAGVFLEAGAEILLDTASPMTAIMAAMAATDREKPAVDTITVAVTGARGAPGRTELSLALAWHWGADALVAELDHDAPALGLRTAQPPLRHVPDPAIDRPMPFPRFGPVSVFVPPPAGGPLSTSVVARILDAAQATHRRVVMDVGPGACPQADASIVVCDASPVGLVRCARLLDRWLSGQPILVVNRIDEQTDLSMVRRATGLEPAAAIPSLSPPLPGDPPLPGMVERLAQVARSIDRSARSAA